MNTCQGVTSKGKKCSRKVSTKNSFCFQHSVKNNPIQSKKSAENDKDNFPLAKNVLHNDTFEIFEKCQTEMLNLMKNCIIVINGKCHDVFKGTNDRSFPLVTRLNNLILSNFSNLNLEQLILEFYAILNELDKNLVFYEIIKVVKNELRQQITDNKDKTYYRDIIKIINSNFLKNIKVGNNGKAFIRDYPNEPSNIKITNFQSNKLTIEPILAKAPKKPNKTSSILSAGTKLFGNPLVLEKINDWYTWDCHYTRNMFHLYIFEDDFICESWILRIKNDCILNNLCSNRIGKMINNSNSIYNLNTQNLLELCRH